MNTQSVKVNEEKELPASVPCPNCGLQHTAWFNGENQPQLTCTACDTKYQVMSYRIEVEVLGIGTIRN